MEKIDINNLDINILPLEGELKGALERIPIPEGLEERLEAKIDEWDEASRTVAIRPKHNAKKYFALAASFLLVCGIGLYFALAPTTNKGTTDTYSDPQLACREAERALNLLSANLNKGLTQYEQAIN